MHRDAFMWAADCPDATFLDTTPPTIYLDTSGVARTVVHDLASSSVRGGVRREGARLLICHRLITHVLI